MWWNKYLGDNFEIKGRGPDKFDCWGLVKYVYERDHPQKLILPGYDELYQNTNERENISNIIFSEKKKHWREISEPQEFDVVLLRMRGVPMHVGIVTGNGLMLHCSRGVGTSHEKYNGIRWRNKVLGFYRYG